MAAEASSVTVGRGRLLVVDHEVVEAARLIVIARAIPVRAGGVARLCVDEAACLQTVRQPCPACCRTLVLSTSIVEAAHLVVLLLGVVVRLRARGATGFKVDEAAAA